MTGPFTWIDLGGERRIDLDPPGTPGGRYLAVRRKPGGSDDGWVVACVLQPGEEEREVGEDLAGHHVAEDVALKVGIQGLARLHGVSPVPGLPEAGASDAEHLIARLWLTLRERWAPGGVVPGPAAGVELDEGGGDE